MRLAALLALFFALGCTSARQPSPSVEQSKLAQAESRALALARSGDYRAAAGQYAEALRLARALENAESIAANAVNLSVVQQWLGRDAEAKAALAAVLDDPRTPFSERRRLQAELRRVILELAAGNITAAALYAGQAARRCPELACDYAATLLNVQAQVELEAGRPAGATKLAQSALERSKGAGQRSEAANALRTLGRAQHLQGNAPAALPLLREALELDRELGDPRKILTDLGELSRAADAAGDADAARTYRERAAAVARAMQEGRTGAAMEALLNR